MTRGPSQIWCFFDHESGMEKFGSGINIPEPQHWSKGNLSVPKRYLNFEQLFCPALRIRILTNLLAMHQGLGTWSHLSKYICWFQNSTVLFSSIFIMIKFFVCGGKTLWRKTKKIFFKYIEWKARIRSTSHQNDADLFRCFCPNLLQYRYWQRKYDLN